MKLFFVLCALALTLSLEFAGVRPASAQGAELSATEILQKSLKTYGELQTYRGTCAVTNEQISAFGNGKPQHIVTNARATFNFKRGERLSIQGQNILGNQFEALSTLDKTWIESPTGAPGGVQMSPQQREDARQTFGGLEDSENFDQVTSALFSLTQGAASVVPTLLMGDSPGNPLRRPPGATLLPDQKILGDDCYVVRHDFVAMGVVTTFWVDKQTFLLRRMQQEQNMKFQGQPIASDSINLFIFINDEAK